MLHEYNTIHTTWLAYLNLASVPLGAPGDLSLALAILRTPCRLTPISSTSSLNILPCLLRYPTMSSVVFWHQVHSYMGGHFSMQSEDMASHLPSCCCDIVLESLHACPCHHPLWRGRATRYRGVYACNGDGRHVACVRSCPLSSASHMHKLPCI